MAEEFHPPAIKIQSLDDPCIAGYRNLRERDLRGEGLFITEGALLAERLLASRFRVESLLVAAGHEAEYEALLQRHNRSNVLLYSAAATLLREITGFDFHRGILGLGRRVPFPSVEELTAEVLQRKGEASAVRLVACPGTETVENLGMILRSANAFGVDGILLPIDGADPLSRRCLRQSMGSALTIPIARAEDLLNGLRVLKANSGFELVAAVAAESSRGEDVIPLPALIVPSHSVLVVGNEFHGLSDEWLQLCEYHVTIPIAPLCDSLNAAVATGIFLYHLSLGAR